MAWEAALKVGKCPALQVLLVHFIWLQTQGVSLHLHFRLSLQLVHNVLSLGIFWRQRDQYQRTGAPAQLQQRTAPLLGMPFPFFGPFSLLTQHEGVGVKHGCPVLRHGASRVSKFHLFLLSVEGWLREEMSALTGWLGVAALPLLPRF